MSFFLLRASLALGLLAALGFPARSLLVRLAAPPPEPPLPDEQVVEKSPLRGEFRPLRLQRDDATGFVFKCSECHRFLETRLEDRPLVAEHEDLVLNHGRNDYCLNCHHPDNRDAYVTHDGKEIPWSQPAELCAKCHGPVHRDWRHGAHGRRQGYWDASQGARERLLCIQCHDPHDPAFPPLPPMPPPRRSAAGQGVH